MSKALIELSRGTVFKFCGLEWILLEQTTGGCLALSKNVVCNRLFDADNHNDYSQSTIRRYLNGDFVENIGENAVDFKPYELDLTADDGTTYGKCTDRIFLITTDIYRRNRDILDPIDAWWWTATAFSASADQYSVQQVFADGTLNKRYAAYGDGGVRPACFLNYNAPVTIDGTDDEIRAERRTAMQNLLVRARDAEGWRHGYYVHQLPRTGAFGQQFESADLERHLIYEKKGGCYDINIKTLGRCLGFRDKNDTMIYEGDIVKKGSELLAVLWNENKARFDLYDRMGWQSGNVFSREICQKCEVVGNIHDNPELMNE